MVKNYIKRPVRMEERLPIVSPTDTQEPFRTNFRAWLQAASSRLQALTHLPFFSTKYHIH